MKQAIINLGWIFYGTCPCNGYGEKYKKNGKTYRVQIYPRIGRFSIINQFDTVVKSGYAYELTQIVSDYEKYN